MTRAELDLWDTLNLEARVYHSLRDCVSVDMLYLVQDIMLTGETTTMRYRRYADVSYVCKQKMSCLNQ